MKSFRGGLFLIVWLIGAFGWLPSQASEKASAEALLQPFEGFSEAGMAPLIELLRADPEGRQLLRKTLSRAKLKNVDELTKILTYCGGEDLFGSYERRGLFTQTTAYFYREKGNAKWQDGGSGELTKLEEPDKFPVLAENQYQTANFDHREVAFRPQICLKRGMSILQTYLVLFHELVHLTGIQPFAQIDLFSFTQTNKEGRYYYKQLGKKGGEVEAYLAQLQAFKRLKKRYDIPETWVLEGFLDPKGRLDYRDREAFMDHLLEQAGYRDQLDHHLEQQILLQYNRSYAWWEYLNRLLEHYDGNLDIIEGNLKNISEQIAPWKKAKRKAPQALLDARKEWRQKKAENRKKRKAYRAEQLDLERFMEKVDQYHPRE